MCRVTELILLIYLNSHLINIIVTSSHTIEGWEYLHTHMIFEFIGFKNPYACLSRSLFTANFSSNLFTRDETRNSSHQWYMMNRVSSKRTNVLLWVRARRKIKKFIIEIHLGRFCDVYMCTHKCSYTRKRKASLFYLIKSTICLKASSSSSSLIMMIILDSLIEIRLYLSHSLAVRKLLFVRSFSHNETHIKASEWGVKKVVNDDYAQ